MGSQRVGHSSMSINTLQIQEKINPTAPFWEHPSRIKRVQMVCEALAAQGAVWTNGASLAPAPLDAALAVITPISSSCPRFHFSWKTIFLKSSDQSKNGEVEKLAHSHCGLVAEPGFIFPSPPLLQALNWTKDWMMSSGSRPQGFPREKSVTFRVYGPPAPAAS